MASVWGVHGWFPPLIAVILKLHKHCYHGSPFSPAKIASYLVIFKPVFRRNMACSWGLKLHIKKKKLCGIINVFHNIQPPKICCLQHQHFLAPFILCALFSFVLAPLSASVASFGQLFEKVHWNIPRQVCLSCLNISKYVYLYLYLYLFI